MNVFAYLHIIHFGGFLKHGAKVLFGIRAG
jgi:hypothetical protein